MYTPNNINFRIVSSKTIAQFKHDQSFDFAELVYNNKVVFSPQSREIVLLGYEEWFNFILMLEKYFISLDDKATLEQRNVQYILELMSNTKERIAQVMTEHPQYFGEHVTKLISRIGSPILVKYMLSGVANIVGKSIYTAFPYVVTLISETLHQGLLALAEYETLLHKPNEAVINCETYPVAVMDSAPPSCELALSKAMVYHETCGVKEFTLSTLGEDDDTAIASVVKKLTDNGFGVKNIETH